ncbi:unnamed protein product [Porites evermanni]|uniref:Uncharacterized protein n=1 Tax=Porites evermanni TaxID=104178 RepID=A0ABN8MFD3_9CNID|nr:unnamed protein product [Porites evermanni]
MEAAVKMTKTMMCKALRDGTDQYEALLELRNTPRQDTGISPAEMMFGKNTRSLLPSTGTKSIPNGKDGVYRRNRVHLCPTTPEMSPENSSSPASALNSHKLQGHMDTEKSQDTNRLNKSQAV